MVGGELVMDLVKGEPERLLPVDSEHAALAHGAPPRAPRGPQARRDHRVRRAVPRLDPERARPGVGQGGAPAPGVVDGSEDHDRLRHADEQGPRGDRGALPVRPGVLADPRPDPPRGASCTRWRSSATAACAPRWRPPTCGCRSSSRSPGRSGCRTGWSRSRSRDRPLTFEPVDREAFPAVDLAYRVGGLGLTFPAVMNAANEVAVMAFLEGKIPLTRIVEIVQTVVDEHEPASIVSVVNIERADAWARAARGRDHRGALAPVSALAIVAVLRRPPRDHPDPRVRALPAGARVRVPGPGVLRGVRPEALVVPPRRDRVRA